MSNPPSVDSKNPKKSFLSMFTWWKTDPAEVRKQLTQYETLKVWQSARGISALLCLFTVAVTVLFGNFMHLSGEAIAIDAILWSGLGLFMYRGTRWAFIVGMVLWTLEKVIALYGGLSAGATPIMQVIWWAIYMSAFFLAFKVESERAKPPATIPLS
jgi:hypothetical protein